MTRDRKYTDKLPSGVELFFRPIGLITIHGTNKSDIDLYMSFRAGDSLGFNFTFLSFEMGYSRIHTFQQCPFEGPQALGGLCGFTKIYFKFKII